MRPAPFVANAAPSAIPGTVCRAITAPSASHSTGLFSPSSFGSRRDHPATTPSSLMLQTFVHACPGSGASTVATPPADQRTATRRPADEHRAGHLAALVERVVVGHVDGMPPSVRSLQHRPAARAPSGTGTRAPAGVVRQAEHHAPVVDAVGLGRDVPGWHAEVDGAAHAAVPPQDGVDRLLPGSVLSAKPTTSPRSFRALACTSRDPSRGEDRMTVDGAHARWCRLNRPSTWSPSRTKRLKITCRP